MNVNSKKHSKAQPGLQEFHLSPYSLIFNKEIKNYLELRFLRVLDIASNIS